MNLRQRIKKLEARPVAAEAINRALHEYWNTRSLPSNERAKDLVLTIDRHYREMKDSMPGHGRQKPAD